MNNFYGKRFLSSLVGALTVLGSPVASAGKNGSGGGDLGKGVHSAGRNKNNGKLGELKSNREVKNVDGLKKVLKETGGEVVRVSPDGKGGFVAFVKTPTGIVTVAIVGVPLLVIISYLVFFRRKSNGGSGENVDDGDNRKDKSLISDTNLNINEDNKIENAKGDLLDKLFGGDQGEYDLFVDKLLREFFDNQHVRKMFDNCGGNLDEFLKSVFSASSFGVGGNNWIIEIRDDLGAHIVFKFINLSKGKISALFTSKSKNLSGFCGVVMSYLSEVKLVRVPVKGEEASWGDKISAVLFGFWYLVKFGWESRDLCQLEKCLRKKDPGNFEEIFKTISDYVKVHLEAAGRNNDGQVIEES